MTLLPLVVAACTLTKLLVNLGTCNNTSVIQQTTLLPLCNYVMTLTLPTPTADTVQPSPSRTGSGASKSL